MPTVEEIRRITIQATSSGVDQVTSALDKLAGAQTKVASTGDGVAVSQDRVEKSSLSTARAVDNLRKSIDPAFAAQQKLERGTATVNRAFAQGSIGIDAHSRLIQQLHTRYSEVTPAVDKATASVHASAAAHVAHGHAAQGNYQAMQESQHVIRAFTDVLLAGGSPMRAFEFEMGRIAEIAGGPGGLNVLFQAGAKYVGGYLSVITSVLNPVTAAGAAIAAVAIAGVASFVSWESHLDKMAQSLSGLGRASGLTLDNLNKIALGGARSAGISGAQGQALAAQFSGAGLSGTLTGQLIDDSKIAARVLGVDMAEAGKLLAKSFVDPVKGIDELDKSLGFLDDKTRQTIKSLAAQGDIFGAQQAMLTALQPRIEGVTDRTWSLSKAWEAVGHGISSATTGLGQFLQQHFDPSTEDLLRAAIQQRQAKQTNPGYAAAQLPIDLAPQNYPASDPRSAGGDINATVRQLTAQAKTEREEAATQGLDAQVAASAKAAGDAIRAAVSDIGKRAGLSDQRDALGRELGTPGVREGLSPEAAAGADAALANLTNRLEAFRTAAQQITEDSNLAAQATEARTGTEKTAIEAQKAWLDVMRSTGVVTTAAAAATAKWTEAIAQSNKSAEDAVRSADQRAALSGKFGLGRDLAENQQHFDNDRRNATFAPDSAAVSPPLRAAAQAMTPLDALPPGVRAQIALTKPGRGSELTRFQTESPDDSNPNAAFGSLPAYGFSHSPIAAASQVTLTPAVRSTASAGFGAAQSTTAGSIVDEHTVDVLARANRELDAQVSLENLKAATYGKSTAAVIEATTRQEMLNKAMLDNVSAATIGPDRWASFAAGIDAYAKKAGEAAEATERLAKQQKQIVDAMDTVRSAGREALGTFVSDLEKGKSGADALRDALLGVVNKLAGMAEDQIINSLFGQAGKPGGGILGGGLSSIFGGLLGGQSAATAPVSFGAFGGLYADGGQIRGAGSARSDSILARVSNGEFIVNASATQQHLSTLHAINSNSLPRFADGGIVDMRAATAARAALANRGGGNVTQHNVTIGDTVIQTQGDVNSEAGRRALQAILAQHQADTIRKVTKALPAVQARQRSMGTA